MIDPVFPQIPEGQYLSDYFEGERLSAEQKFFRPIEGGLHPGVKDEGSWINNPRNPRNQD